MGSGPAGWRTTEDDPPGLKTRPPQGGRVVYGGLVAMLRGMRGAPNIVLIGPMGSGKTAVGRSVARHLGRAFYDSDAEIVRRTGVDIPYIFEKEGEAGFRQRERETIEALVALEGIVLATGGGAVLLPENRRSIAQRGCVIYLETSVAQQAQRVRQGRNRPLLSNVDPTIRLEELMAVRDPLYRSIADIVVSTDGRRVKAVAGDIVRMIR
jgi:shikimate kinase